MLFVSSNKIYARVAQLVEHDLAKVGVAGSSPVSRSQKVLIFKAFLFFVSYFVSYSLYVRKLSYQIFQGFFVLYKITPSHWSMLLDRRYPVLFDL